MKDMDKILDHYEYKEFSKAVKLIMQIADNTNKFINENTPWKIDQKDAIVIASTALNVFKNLCILLAPIMPNLCCQMLKMLKINSFGIDNLEDKMINWEIDDFKPIISRVEPINIKDFY